MTWYSLRRPRAIISIWSVFFHYCGRERLLQSDGDDCGWYKDDGCAGTERGDDLPICEELAVEY